MVPLQQPGLRAYRDAWQQAPSSAGGENPASRDPREDDYLNDRPRR
jgi:hypothetical protein